MTDDARKSLERIETKKRHLFQRFAEKIKADDNTTYRIFVEGNDGIGKSTACKKMAEFFAALGLSTKLISFPDYDTETGALLKKIYRETSPDDRHPELDMYIHKANIREALFKYDDKEEYDIIIFDRSPISNFLYHASLPVLSKYTNYSVSERLALSEYLYNQYEHICGDEMKIFYFNNKVKVVDKIFIMYGIPHIPEDETEREYDKNDRNNDLQARIRNICEFIDKAGYECFNTKLYNEFYLNKNTMAWNAKGRYLPNATLFYSVLYSLFFDELTSEM